VPTFEAGSAASGPGSSFVRPGIRAVTATVAIAVMLAGPLVLAAPTAAQTGRESIETWPGQDADVSGFAANMDAHTTTNLNLRNGPSLQDDVQTVIPAGSAVEITGTAENGFYPVTYASLEGFAHGDYLVTGEAPANAGEPASGGTGVDESNESSGNGIVQIIYSAAAMYGQSGDDMLRVARCESGLNPGAVNGSSNASGLFQFLPSTWATTPYAGQDIFDPVANAEAAAWMWANGRRGEWSCQ
jgi:soluble lytic murein transglycosylase-like protein